MTRKQVNSKVHARLTRMLAHAGVGSYTREEWATIVRPLVDAHGAATKVIARTARDEILASREGRTIAPVAHDPIAEAAAWMPRV